MGLDHHHWSEARQRIRDLLTTSAASLPKDSLVSRSEVTMHLPADIGDYTDFYSSLDHATNVGTMFRYKFIKNNNSCILSMLLCL